MGLLNSLEQRRNVNHSDILEELRRLARRPFSLSRVSSCSDGLCVDCSADNDALVLPRATKT